MVAPLQAPPSAEARRGLVAVCLALVASAWGGNQFTPLLVLYRSADHWSATTVDALLAAYVLGLAPALVVGGRVSDRHGRRRPVLAALAASAVGSCSLGTGTLVGVAAGRLLSGAGVGLAMAVGATWVTELSVASGASRPAGARRASLSLTVGFGLGAGVAGCLAQWAPLPETLPYLVHLALDLVALGWVASRAAETRAADAGAPAPPGTRSPLLPASASTRRFRRVVVPAAPWVFGTAGVAYAIVPQALAHAVGRHALVFATLLTVVTLGTGVAAQPQVRRFDRSDRPVALRAAMALVVVGILLAAWAAASASPALAVVAAAVLGPAYGIGLVAGLLEVQRCAPTGELASLTGLFGALTYIGFLMPTALALAAPLAGTPTELVVLAAVAAVCGAGLRAAPAA